MKVEFRNVRSGEEKAVAELLARSFGRDETRLDHWMWKFGNRPGFDFQDVVVAVENGDLIGCLHSIRTELFFEKLGELPSAVVGDLAMLPGKRELGHPRRMLRLLEENLRSRGRFFLYGFAPDELAVGYYHSRLGMGYSKGGVRAYSKLLGEEGVARRVEALSEALRRSPELRRELSSLSFSIRFDFGRDGRFCVVVSDGELSVGPGPAGMPAVRVRSSLLLAQLLLGRRGRLSEYVRAILMRPPFLLGAPRSFFGALRLVLALRKLRKKGK